MHYPQHDHSITGSKVALYLYSVYNAFFYGVRKYKRLFGNRRHICVYRHGKWAYRCDRTDRQVSRFSGFFVVLDDLLNGFYQIHLNTSQIIEVLYLDIHRVTVAGQLVCDAFRQKESRRICSVYRVDTDRNDPSGTQLRSSDYLLKF